MYDHISLEVPTCHAGLLGDKVVGRLALLAPHVDDLPAREGGVVPHPDGDAGRLCGAGHGRGGGLAALGVGQQGLTCRGGAGDCAGKGGGEIVLSAFLISIVIIKLTASLMLWSLPPQ